MKDLILEFQKSGMRELKIELINVPFKDEVQLCLTYMDKGERIDLKIGLANEYLLSPQFEGVEEAVINRIFKQ